MIHLVETTDESLFLLVADHIATLLNEAGQDGSTLVAECAALISEDKFDAYLNKLQAHLDLVFTAATAQDCECICDILVHAVSKVPEAGTAAAAKSLASALASKLDDHAELRLSAVLNLYGVTSRPEVQLPVLMAAAEYAQQQPRLANMMAAMVKGCSEQWVGQWNLPEAQARNLYLALAALVKASDLKAAPKLYMRLLIATLKLAQEGDTAALQQLKPHAVDAVARYTSNPSNFQVDLGELPAVRFLATDPQYAPLYKLMTTMLSGDVASYRAAATPQALEMAGMSAEDALHKARMSALLALGTKAGHEEVTFSQIQAALDIPEDQVELFLVRAIGSKLLEGKIDQVRGAVSITRCTMRAFGSAEWKSIRAKLANWRESIVAVQQNLSGTKAGSASAGVPSRGHQAIKV